MESDACSKLQLVDKLAYAFELAFFDQHCACEAVEGRFGRKAPALFVGFEVDKLSYERQIVGLESGYLRNLLSSFVELGRYVSRMALVIGSAFLQCCDLIRRLTLSENGVVTLERKVFFLGFGGCCELCSGV